VSESCFYKQGDDKSCAPCFLLVLCVRHHRPKVVISAGNKGISPKKIRAYLRKWGISSRIRYIRLKDTTTLKYRIRLLTVFYFPRNHHNGIRGDHYVLVMAVRTNKALVYDSTEDGPIWISWTALVKKWRMKNGKGWAIETWV